MGNPMCPAKEKDVQKVDIMLCTHGHGDHIGDAVEIGKKHNPVAVGIFELCMWLQKKGVKQVSPMNKGGTQTVGDIKVTMVHADHSCGILDGDQIIYGGEACGYVIEFANGVKIYHGGDTNVFGDMEIIRELLRAEDRDVAHRRSFHDGPARGSTCLQTAQAEVDGADALRNVPAADRNDSCAEEVGLRGRNRGDEDRRNAYVNPMPDTKPKPGWRMSGITADAVDDYLYSLIPPRDEVLAEMEDYAAKNKVQSSARSWREFCSRWPW